MIRGRIVYVAFAKRGPDVIRIISEKGKSP